MNKNGVSGVVHVATIFGNEPDMIEKVIAMNRNLLITASKEPTVKRFVYTSSSEAAVFSSFLEHDEKNRTKITSDTWNDIAVERVRHQMSPATPKSGFDVYAASKALGEQAIWDWVKIFKPDFVVNTGKLWVFSCLAIHLLIILFKCSRQSASEPRSSLRSRAMLLHLVGQQQYFKMSFIKSGLC